MVQIFKEYFIFCLDIIATAKIHGIAPKENYSVCLFWIYTAFVGRYGDVVIILSQTYSAEIVFMMKEEKKQKKMHETKKWGSELLNVIFMSAISFDEGFYLCSFVTNYVLSCLRMWRTSFVLFSTIFNMTFLFIYLMDISSIRGVWLTGMCQLTLRWRYSASWNV